MNKSITLTLIAILTWSMGYSQGNAKNAKPAKVVTRKIDGIPQPFPTKKSDQRKWFIRWTIRGKMPTTMIATFVTILEDERKVVEGLIEKEEERSKPRRPLLRYYKKHVEWLDEQVVILKEVSSLKLKTFVFSKDHPAHIKKREELENQIKEKVKEFRKIINQKPSKPE